MSKGSRRERQALEIYEAAGYWVYSPQNPQYGDNDLWNLFDLACFNPKYGQLRFVQVKSNGARGITKWCHLARRFNALSCVLTDFVVPYDREGWRLVRPAEDGHTTVYDEREYSVSMGDGITEFLRGETEAPHLYHDTSVQPDPVELRYRPYCHTCSEFYEDPEPDRVINDE